MTAHNPLFPMTANAARRAHEARCREVDREVATREYCESLAQAAAAREAAAYLAAAERATGRKVGDRVKLVDICSEQSYLLGRVGTVIAFARGGSGWELDVALDEPWDRRGSPVCLPVSCWRVR